MALTQDRMIAVITDGQTAEKAYLDLRASLEAILDQASGQELSLLEALQAIAQLLKETPARLFLADLTFEAKHFERNSRKNDRMRLYLQNKREREGIKPRTQFLAERIEAPHNKGEQPKKGDFSHLQADPQAIAYMPLNYNPAPQPLAEQKLSITAIDKALRAVPPPSGHVPLTPKTPPPQAPEPAPSGTLILTSDPDIERDLSEKEPDILAPLPSVF